MTQNITANADTKNPLSDTDKAWLGGVLDSFGALMVVEYSGRKSVALRFKSTSKVSTLVHVATLLEITARKMTIGKGSNAKQGVYFQLSGTPLHGVMTMVWPYLTLDRKREYAEKRRIVKEETQG